MGMRNAKWWAGAVAVGVTASLAGLAVARSPAVRGGPAGRGAIPGPVTATTKAVPMEPATAPRSGTTPATTSAPHLPPRVESAHCEGGTTSTTPAQEGDPAARRGAQRGLAFITRNTLEWQTAHQCYGCHVQAVTLEALSVGKSHHYDIPQRDLDALLKGMLDLPGGAHQSAGFTYTGGALTEPSHAFGGAALAHYDALVNDRLRKELLDTAAQLLPLQAKDGHVGDYANGPVAVGPIQSTTQALQTWRQAYERTGDERWLPAMRRAEDWIHGRTAQLLSPGSPVDQVAYGIVGLISAGASRSEVRVQGLVDVLQGAQGKDGSWRTALNTGASLYALRLAGLGDNDPPVARGVRWLLAHQAEDGGWSHAGFSRGEAMWAVLGLVTLDALSVELSGISNGQNIKGQRVVHAKAIDNGGHAVRRIELSIDNVPLTSQCSDKLDFTVDGGWLSSGAHTLDVLAENDQGQKSHRTLTVYPDSFYLTELGTRFEDNGTTVALRDVAPPELAHKIGLRIFPQKNGKAASQAPVFESTREGQQGPVRFFWNGRDGQGHVQPHDTFVAEVRLLDAAGKVLQQQETSFVNDTVEAQQTNYGAISGQLRSGDQLIGNTSVELVDGQGHVVQQVMSTAQGNYQFYGVAAGDYRVRVNRDGFKKNDAPVHAEKARMKDAPMELMAE